MKQEYQNHHTSLKKSCEKCDGNGFYLIKKSSPCDNYIFFTCDLCNGSGTIDWIQNILKRSGHFLQPVKDVLESFYYRKTGKLVLNKDDEISMLSFCYFEGKKLSSEEIKKSINMCL